MNVKAKQRKLDKRIQSAQDKIRSLEFKKMVDRDSYPDYIYHYKNDFLLGKERLLRVAYVEEKPKTKEPSSYFIDIRQFVKRRRKVKEGEEIYRPVFRQGLNIPSNVWHSIFMQFVDMTMELSEPADWISVLQNIIDITQEKYPYAFAEMQSEKKQVTQPDNVASLPQKKIVEQKPPKKMANKTIEDTNFQRLATIGKNQKRKAPSQIDWIKNNL
jgi:hypothetical protein